MNDYIILEAVKLVKYNGVYRNPGTPFKCDAETANMLINTGAATDVIDPQMLKIAKQKKEETIDKIKAKEALMKSVHETNADVKKKIEKLSKELDHAERKSDFDKVAAINQEVQIERTKIKSAVSISKELEELKEELKRYDIQG